MAVCVRTCVCVVHIPLTSSTYGETNKHTHTHTHFVGCCSSILCSFVRAILQFDLICVAHLLLCFLPKINVVINKHIHTNTHIHTSPTCTHNTHAFSLEIYTYIHTYIYIYNHKYIINIKCNSMQPF